MYACSVLTKNIHTILSKGMEKSLKCLAKSFDVPGAFSVLFLPVVQDALTHYVRGVLQIEQCLADARRARPLSFHLRSIEQK